MARCRVEKRVGKQEEGLGETRKGARERRPVEMGHQEKSQNDQRTERREAKRQKDEGDDDASEVARALCSSSQ